MNTLLDKARNYSPDSKPKREMTKEDVELALAWLRGEIGISAVTVAYGAMSHHTTRGYVNLARALRTAYVREQLLIAGEER